MACNYCYHSDPKNLPFDKKFMDVEVARKIIWQCYEYGVSSIKFNYRGESTLHPNFLEFTRTTKELAEGSIFIDRLTNSNFKFATNRDDIFEALSYQTKVKVSFDSFISTVMETQRALSNHALIMANIDKFYNWPGRKTKLVIQAVRTKLNKNEDIEGEIRKRWPEAGYSIRDMVAGRVDKDLSSMESKTRDASKRQSCIQAHARLIFGHDGRAQVCCPDIGSKIIVGDIREQTLNQIWHSEEAKKIRKALNNKAAFESEPCKNCSSYETYRGYKAPWDS